MAEEQRLQEGHRLCANNCGFFGSPATLDLCSKCYRDFRLNEDQASSAKIAVEKSLKASVSSSSSSVVVTEASIDVRVPLASPEAAAASPSTAARTAPNRCVTCRKKVGLTGFTCRCGATCCGVHRYPEQHACAFDFMGAGRDAIARANPVIKADKLDKI